MRWLLPLCLLCLTSSAHAETAASDPEMTCGAESVRQKLAESLADRLCLDDNLTLAELALQLSFTAREVKVEDLLTTELSEVPLRRVCEAQLSFQATIEAEALGPAPGRLHRLLLTGEPRTITYAVGRFDDGRLYVRPTPGCWKVDRLEPKP
jgi:hypothetical protein